MDSRKNKIGKDRDPGGPSNYAGGFPYARAQQFCDRRLQNGGTVVLFRKRR
jgi:hypothetical protein